MKKYRKGLHAKIYNIVEFINMHAILDFKAHRGWDICSIDKDYIVMKSYEGNILVSVF